nr:hypothetical protein [Tanacetum cinerariifolium]
MGEFNEVRCMEDRMGSVFNVQGANEFNNFIYIFKRWRDVKIRAFDDATHKTYLDMKMLILPAAGIGISGNRSSFVVTSYVETYFCLIVLEASRPTNPIDGNDVSYRFRKVMSFTFIEMAHWSDDTDTYYNRWEVEVFSLSSRVWKRVSIDSPLKPCDLSFGQVCIDGFIYWHAFDNIIEEYGVRANIIISYDLTSGVFAEVSLPDCLVYAHTLSVYKRDQCLTLLEYYKEDEITVCGIWVMKDGVTGSFAKTFTVKVAGKTNRVLEFRKNGEA